MLWMSISAETWQIHLPRHTELSCFALAGSTTLKKLIAWVGLILKDIFFLKNTKYENYLSALSSKRFSFSISSSNF